MLFRTEFNPKIQHALIDAGDKLFLIGSCFAENISKKLINLNWDILSNPHGILFNPASVQRCVSDISELREYDSSDLHFSEELYHSFSHHGSFSGRNEEDTLHQINTKLQFANAYLKNSKWCIITLGSAWVYRHIATDTIVANCHKIPQKEFTKELLSVSEITHFLEATVNLLKSIHPEIKIIFTVSPVRYLKDGFIENSRSKAHLITSIHEIIENESDLFYFPAYELFMDDLRDYRFTNEDMIHPNEMAIEYIWQKFIACFFGENAINFNADMQQLANMKNHRPLNMDTKSFSDFTAKIRQFETQMFQKYPFLNFEK